MTARRILIGAWIVFVLYGYPGFVRNDVLDQLVDSRVGVFTDWHSPMFTEVWRLLGRVFAGPAPLFVLDGTMILLGVYSLARRAISERAAAGTAAFVLLFPPLIATTAQISEAGTMTAFVVGGAALLLGQTRRRKIAGAVLLVIACGLQDGAALAVLPLAVAGIRIGTTWQRRLGTGLVAWIAIVGISVVVDYALVDTHSDRRAVSLAIFDIDGIAHSHTPAPTSNEGAQQLIAKRRTLSREQPSAYLAYRTHTLLRELGFFRTKRWQPVYTEVIPASQRLALAHAAHHSLAQRMLIWPVKKLGRSLLFRPYLYFFLGIVLLPVALVRRHALAALMIVSALGYELALGVVTFDPAYTDSHWMMVAIVLAAAVVAVREREARLEARNERVRQQAALGVANDDRV